MSALDWIVDVVDRIVSVAAAALTIFIVAVLLVQIYFRYVLNSSLIWSEEVATWAMIWLVFIGSITVMKQWGHVHIPLFIQALPLRLRPPFVVFAKAATAIAVGLIAWYGIQMVLGRFHITSQTTGISSAWNKLSVPIGAALMLLVVLQALIEDVRRWRRGDLDAFARYGDMTEGEAPAADEPPR